MTKNELMNYLTERETNTYRVESLMIDIEEGTLLGNDTHRYRELERHYRQDSEYFESYPYTSSELLSYNTNINQAA